MNRKERKPHGKKDRGPAVPLPIPPVLLQAHETPALQALAQWKEQNKVPPVLLISGPRGCGKREIAYHFVQTLQCERAGFSPATEEDAGGGLFGGMEMDFGSPSPSEANSDPSPYPAPCGECAACARVLSGQALDFQEIALENDAQTLKIDQFREIRESLGFSSYSGGYRIFLVQDAETMTVQAANSLLKILEEPPQGWIFILTVSDPTLLPSTVVSRCQILRLRPLPEPVLKELLRESDLPSDRIPLLSVLAEGSLKRAMELGAEEAWTARETLLRFLTHPQSVYHALVDYAAAEPANFRLMLDQFERILNDLVLRAESSSFPYRNADAVRTLDDHAARCAKRRGGSGAALTFWIERSERLFKIRREMAAPLNQKVLAQDFLAPWLDAV